MLGILTLVSNKGKQGEIFMNCHAFSFAILSVIFCISKENPLFNKRGRLLNSGIASCAKGGRILRGVLSVSLWVIMNKTVNS
ncbi:hypothetical protein [Neobacillus vireti]|uniref:Uncharacterized protein n=1 Tax=Neobacillus vireti LMG 21834 TaxID=1131730 RepID=A0AB94IL10_9BACI|nr:hypothetical protein [Neobacillus vireti]ETI67756.1 hypothetical protein BAVI_15952 [Neobacillus vireti LMG 21834]KLT16116.1 hypothetical protein AA980_19310 [Neobacillus vireti]